MSEAVSRLIMAAIAGSGATRIVRINPVENAAMIVEVRNPAGIVITPDLGAGEFQIGVEFEVNIIYTANDGFELDSVTTPDRVRTDHNQWTTECVTWQVTAGNQVAVFSAVASQVFTVTVKPAPMNATLDLVRITRANGDLIVMPNTCGEYRMRQGHLITVNYTPQDSSRFQIRLIEPSGARNNVPWSITGNASFSAEVIFFTSEGGGDGNRPHDPRPDGTLLHEWSNRLSHPWLPPVSEHELDLGAYIAGEAYFPYFSDGGNNNPRIPGGTLKVAVDGDPTEWNMFSKHNGSITANTLRTLLYSRLIQVGRDNRIYMDLADSLSVDTHNKTITMTIKQDGLFHDGVNLTLYDVLGTIETAAKLPGTPLFELWKPVIDDNFTSGDSEYLQNVKLIEGDTKIQFCFPDQPAVAMHDFLFSLAHPLAGILPKHLTYGIPIESLYEHPKFRHETIGSGPFKVSGIFVPGESIHLMANENYFLDKPYLDAIYLEHVDFSLRGSAAETGQFHVVMNVGHGRKNINNVRFSAITSNTPLALVYRKTPSGDKPIDNAALRKAIQYAMDINTLLQEFPGTFAFGDYEDEAGVRRSIYDEGTFWGLRTLFRDRNIAKRKYNIEFANELLEQAGFQYASDGYRKDPMTNEPFQLKLLVSAADFGFGVHAQLIADFIIQFLREIGINACLTHGQVYGGFQPLSPSHELISESDIILTNFSLSTRHRDIKSVFGKMGVQNFWLDDMGYSFLHEELRGMVYGLNSQSIDCPTYFGNICRSIQNLVNDFTPVSVFAWKEIDLSVNNAGGGVLISPSGNYIDLRFAFLTHPSPYQHMG